MRERKKGARAGVQSNIRSVETAKSEWSNDVYLTLEGRRACARRNRRASSFGTKMMMAEGCRARELGKGPRLSRQVPGIGEAAPRVN